MLPVPIERNLFEVADLKVETKRYAVDAIHTLDNDGSRLLKLLGNIEELDDEKLGNIILSQPDFLFHLVDCTSHDVHGFKFDRFDLKCELGVDLNGSSLVQLPPSTYNDQISQVYDTVRSLWAPNLSMVHRSSAEGKALFLRLCHPVKFTGDGRKILIACKYKRSPFTPRLIHEFGSFTGEQVKRLKRTCERDRHISFEARINSRIAVKAELQFSLSDVAECVAENPFTLIDNSDLPN